MSLPTFETWTEDLAESELSRVDDIIDQIQNHASKGKPIHAEKIAGVVDLREVRVRKVISHLRIGGHPIASSGKGFFWADIPEDLSLTIQHFQGRISKMSVVLAGLRRSFPELEQTKLRL